MLAYLIRKSPKESDIETNISPEKIEFIEKMLEGVSRTFALTIPQLPNKLRYQVGCGYLLCRITDTIEDTVGLNIKDKTHFHELFKKVVLLEESPDNFSESFYAALDNTTPEMERELIKNTKLVIEILQSFTREDIEILQACVTRMSFGMNYFEQHVDIHGLENLRALDSYCYYVAGIVGEMLTGLFCNKIPKMHEKQPMLTWLGVSFGQGLQMTNILKDIWEDQKRDVCWLPKDIFNKYDVSLNSMSNSHFSRGFDKAIHELIGIAHSHLKNAFAYTLHIPKEEAGMRQFCLWAIGLALKTLNNIADNPSFTDSKEIKVSRSTVKKIIIETSIVSKWDKLLVKWFDRASKNLPITPLAYDWDPSLLEVSK